MLNIKARRESAGLFLCLEPGARPAPVHRHAMAAAGKWACLKLMQ